MITLSLFGGVSLEGEGPLDGRIVQRRRLALLALLASSRDRPASRDKLIACLWPERGASQARHSLSDSLHGIHKALGEKPVLAVGDELRLDPEVVSCDVWQFEAALEAGDLERAVGLYAGPFLDGFFIGGDVLEFESWAASERERLARAYLGAVERLAESAATAGEPRQAAKWWRRLCAEDPDNSRAVLGLMEALAAVGDRAGALQRARAHAEHLKSEYGAEPDPTVTALARRLQEEPEVWVPVAAASDSGSAARGAKLSQGSLDPVTGDPEEADGALPGGFRRTFAPRQTFLGAAAAAILVLLTAFYVARRVPESEHLTPEEVLAANAAPGIAVLPFQVADPNLAVWREGLVDLLTSNLDGVGGLRAIDSRTVLAQWHEGVSEGRVPDLETILKIAREAGGSYAVVGSAVTIGANVRLSADVYEVASRGAIGAARAEGPPDSLYPLVDRLSLEVVRAILKDDAERLRAVPDLASVTTTTFPALKAYLEGEALLRKAEFEEAEAEFRRAVEADSTFARAWLGVVQAAVWITDPRELVDEIDRALTLSDRLSQRERMKAEVFRAILLRSWFRARDLAQEFVHSYPDDPDGWLLLSETYSRYISVVPGDPAEGERAIRRAIQLDPAFAPYRMDLLWRSFHDANREEASEQLAVYARLAPEDRVTLESSRLAYALVWGDSAARARAWKAVDTLDAGILRPAGASLLNARFLPVSEALHRETLSRLDKTSLCAFCLTWVLVWEGKIQEAMRFLDHPLMPTMARRRWAYQLHFFRVATLPDTLQHELAFQAADTTSWLFSGAFAADRGRWSEHAAVVQAFRVAARRAGRDSIDSRAFSGAADALEGYGLWRRGKAREALPLLTAGQRNMIGHALPPVWNQFVCWWVGHLYLDLDGPAEAIPYLHKGPWGSLDPFTAYEIGRAYAGLGENRKAVEAYQYALLAWRNADPVLEPRIETARREIARLGASRE